jgi:predicted Zn-dependent peptidase
LIYTIGGGIAIYEYMGVLEIRSSTSPENLLPVFKAIKEELDKLLRDGITEKEFDLARKFQNYSLFMRFDNPADIADFINNQEIDREEIWFPERYIEESKKITKEDINKMAKKIFDFSRMNIGLLGDVPAEKVGEIEKIFQH